LNPLFSVVIPAFNRASIIGKIIDAILKQSFANWQLIVVDDGSIDNTREVVHTFQDSRIQYFFQHNAGVCAARNRGVQQATGMYIAFVDSDDYVSENWLADFSSAFNQNRYDVVVCKRSLASDLADVANSFLAGAFAIDKKIFEAVGGYDEKIRFGENTELKWRLEEAGARFGSIQDVNLVYDNTSNGGSVNRVNKLNSFLHISEKHHKLFSENKALAQRYYQVAGVDAFRIGRTKLANKLLWQGYTRKPQNIKALARVMLYGMRGVLGTNNPDKK